MPKIIDKNFSELLDEEMRLIGLYTPEWKPSQDDLGIALLKIFTHMRVEIISRLNRVPDKNRAAFFDMMGIKLQLPQPARALITFKPAEGSFDSVHVPGGTQLAAPKTESHEALTFQTNAGFSASKASLIEVLSVDPNTDTIHCLNDGLIEKTGKQSGSEDLPKHALFLGHSELFNIKPTGKITLAFYSPDENGYDLGRLKWCYWNGESWIEPQIAEIKPKEGPSRITLIIGTDKCGMNRQIKEREINNVKNLWICCYLYSPEGALDSSADWKGLPKFQSIRVEGIEIDSPRSPDKIAYNFNLLAQCQCNKDKAISGKGNESGTSEEQKIYPFGRQPRLYDSFYISSRDIFSKKAANITVQFSWGDEPNRDVRPSENLTLSLEYWNGTIWNAFPFEDKLDKFKTNNCSLKFVCPDDIQETNVNGALNYWIRLRIADGNYGVERIVSIESLTKIGDELRGISTSLAGDIKKQLDNAIDKLKQTGNELSSEFFPPWFTSICISYSAVSNIKGQLEDCIAYNNLEYIDFTEQSRGIKGEAFRPFLPISDLHPSLHLGFDRFLGKGNTSIFFSVPEDEVLSPNLKWYCWCKAPCIIRDMADSEMSELMLESTEGLMLNTEILIEEDLNGRTIRENALISQISKDRTVTLDRKLFHPFSISARVSKKVRLEALDRTEGLTKSGCLVFTVPSDQRNTSYLGKSCFWIMGEWREKKPDGLSISGIFPNTVWADQIEVVSDEIIGSSNAEKGQEFYFARSPVLSPELWVREASAVAEDDMPLILSEGLNFQQMKDEEGKVKDIWVQWKDVEDFYESKERSRHYVADEVLGRIIFGDGIRGMIPPIGRDNIRAGYNTVGGLSGNVSAGEITALRTSVSGIDRVTNPLSSFGGSDKEDLRSALERGTRSIKSQGRAVTEEDYESLAIESSGSIARTKCIAEGNRIKVVIMPESDEEKPVPSPDLLRMVREHLSERMPVTISPDEFELMGPSYREIRISATIAQRSGYDSISLARAIMERLRDYLHPLRGGRDKAGLPFGRSIHFSELFELLGSIDGVEHIDDLMINDLSRRDLKDKAETYNIDSQEMICSGEHRILIRLGAGK
jgi:hypothetical protein